ncbi:hypothetical protein BV22DRAFT_456687 [Leucogyrophana mollusca]|uniref:Uncharacterized protein n=1 Tax=Leucogyrophana mollusca TaxID=85980 RepID=A0ACB8BIW6_9AGAM|nr:hypothetical protein BV22DRAFT_456687 [Leucogyrophana mollusca]
MYSSSNVHMDRNRSELFAGYNPERAEPGRFFDGPTIEADDDDVEGIKRQTRYMKQESLDSTRNALRLAREAEETARNTLMKLGDQSEKLANTERHLDVSKGHSVRAEGKIDELKQLNRSIFRPVIVFNKDAKHAAREAEVRQRYNDERDERARAAMYVRETRQRLGRASAYDGGVNPDDKGSRVRAMHETRVGKEQRKRYQFEAGVSDDEIEDELDDNMDELHSTAKSLKALGLAMGEEVEQQNKRIDTIDQKAQSLDNYIGRNTVGLKRAV